MQVQTAPKSKRGFSGSGEGSKLHDGKFREGIEGNVRLEYSRNRVRVGEDGVEETWKGRISGGGGARLNDNSAAS